MNHRVTTLQRLQKSCRRSTQLVLIGSVAALLVLVGCGTAPTASEATQLEPAARFRVERRYKVEARVFKAIDETWYDGPWISDEVMVVLRDPERREMTVSRMFGDVDSGETRSFSPQESCILPVDLPQGSLHFRRRGPWSCNASGVPGPFYFTVEMYEVDTDFWTDCFSSWVPLLCGFSVIGYEYVDSNSLFTKGDDLIGHHTLSYSSAELAAWLPRVGDYAEETVRLGPCFDERSCVESPGLPTGPEYTFTWRVTRLPDKRVFSGPVGPVGPLDPTP